MFISPQLPETMFDRRVARIRNEIHSLRGSRGYATDMPRAQCRMSSLVMVRGAPTYFGGLDFRFYGVCDSDCVGCQRWIKLKTRSEKGWMGYQIDDDSLLERAPRMDKVNDGTGGMVAPGKVDDGRS